MLIVRLLRLRPEPHADSLGSHRFSYHAHQLISERVQVSLVAGGEGKLRQHLLGIDLLAEEATVDGAAAGVMRLAICRRWGTIP